MSFFHSLPKDALSNDVHLTDLFNQDTRPSKVNLALEVYQDDNNQTLTLPVVRSVEQQMAKDLTLTKAYLPSTGLDAFCTACLKLVLGEQSVAIVENRACSIQALSGTGALRIGLDFLYRNGFRIAYVSAPTWAIDEAILQSIGFEIRTYRYWSKRRLALDIDGLLADLQDAPEKSIVLLHACAHNPTGCDPTPDQWRRISHVCKARQLVPFFHLPYQGLSSGNLDLDAWAVRYFVHEAQHELFVAQSLSTNFNLYNERIGHLVGVFDSYQIAYRFRTQLTTIVRRNYSNPPAHGAFVVATILANPTLFCEWKNNLRAMHDRIHSTRHLFYNRLKQLGAPGSWEHIVQQTGLFAYTGLDARQCQLLIQRHGVYLMSDGRMNVCAITRRNLNDVAKRFYDAITSATDDA